MKKILKQFLKNDKKLVITFCILVFISFFIDEGVAQVIQLIKTPLLDYIMNWFSHLGSVFVVLVLVTSLFLWEEKRKEGSWVF